MDQLARAAVKRSAEAAYRAGGSIFGKFYLERFLLANQLSYDGQSQASAQFWMWLNALETGRVGV